MIYQQRKQKFKELEAGATVRANRISLVRALLIIVVGLSLFLVYRDSLDNIFLWISAFGVLLFIVAVNAHSKAIRQKTRYAALQQINEWEIGFLEKKELHYDDGRTHVNEQHDFTYDLDFFGPQSLFHNLNRALTQPGKNQFATDLISLKENETILKIQDSVRELASDLSWRQEFSAEALLTKDEKKDLDYLLYWSLKKHPSIPKIFKVLGYVFPGLYILALILRFTSGEEMYGTAAVILFIINLVFVGRHFKAISKELAGSDRLENILNRYSTLIGLIETAPFKTEHFKNIQLQLQTSRKTARLLLQKLSRIYNNLNTASNPMGALLFNGVTQFHFHAYYNLLKWKEENGQSIAAWIESIGKTESLLSLANFSYNNPAFTFPEITENKSIEFEDMGHPLIRESKRINNDIRFNDSSFYIITGSNMSGKSTFLRTVGINLILAGIGSPVCAKKAKLKPVKVVVSMRLSDSLVDDESYFYAEVKRLKYVLHKAEHEGYFVILDEILRGTNSEDKQYGTIAFIEKLINRGSSGLIATHDLEVCKVAEAHPGKVENKRFEVNIEEDELKFDYLLRDGICTSRSASFLLKKMGVID